MTIDSIRVALRGMLANRMRSLLTMLGILSGTAAVILLVAVGTGISNLVQKQIETLGSNALYVFPEQGRGAQDRGWTSARRIRYCWGDTCWSWASNLGRGWARSRARFMSCNWMDACAL